MRQHTLYVTLQIYKHYIKFSSLLYIFLPSAVPDWNELPEQTRNSPSLNIFKNRQKSNLIAPLRYYNTGKRLGQIYHERLRTVCSPLRQHLHSKHIVDSPSRTCDDIEDNHYFSFVCHQFTDLKRDLVNSVSDICQPNLNVLLCGDMSLTFDPNKQIFKAVQEFIIKSKRFEYAYKCFNTALHLYETYLNVCNNRTI